MKHLSGHDRSQLLLLPEAVDDYVGADNPVRFIEAFVEGLDLAALGFIGTVPKTTGRPGYAPADLLKLYIYGYLNRVRSSRRLEAGRAVPGTGGCYACDFARPMVHPPRHPLWLNFAPQRVAALYQIGSLRCCGRAFSKVDKALLPFVITSQLTLAVAQILPWFQIQSMPPIDGNVG
jgi:hypothetical protein